MKKNHKIRFAEDTANGSNDIDQNTVNDNPWKTVTDNSWEKLMISGECLAAQISKLQEKLYKCAYRVATLNCTCNTKVDQKKNYKNTADIMTKMSGGFKYEIEDVIWLQSKDIEKELTIEDIQEEKIWDRILIEGREQKEENDRFSMIHNLGDYKKTNDDGIPVVLALGSPDGELEGVSDGKQNRTATQQEGGGGGIPTQSTEEDEEDEDVGDGGGGDKLCGLILKDLKKYSLKETNEGPDEGNREGIIEGTNEGTDGERNEGPDEANREGIIEGTNEGTYDGILEGTEDGILEAINDGILEGTENGIPVGLALGSLDGELEGVSNGKQNRTATQQEGGGGGIPTQSTEEDEEDEDVGDGGGGDKLCGLILKDLKKYSLKENQTMCPNCLTIINYDPKNNFYDFCISRKKYRKYLSTTWDFGYSKLISRHREDHKNCRLWYNDIYHSHTAKQTSGKPLKMGRKNLFQTTAFRLSQIVINDEFIIEDANSFDSLVSDFSKKIESVKNSIKNSDVKDITKDCTTKELRWMDISTEETEKELILTANFHLKFRLNEIKNIYDNILNGFVQNKEKILRLAKHMSKGQFINDMNRQLTCIEYDPEPIAVRGNILWLIMNGEAFWSTEMDQEDFWGNNNPKLNDESLKTNCVQI